MDLRVGGGYTGLVWRTAILLLLFRASTVICAKGHAWSYLDNDPEAPGPSKWADTIPKCGGQHQSPIDLKNFDDNWVPLPFQFHNYDHKLKQVTVLNNGHTAYLVADQSQASISGGCLNAKYKFVQLHFHWGATNQNGSEHTVNGKRYPMEIHFVHIKDKYSSINDALKDKEGLAVVGLFFQVSDEGNSALDPIVRKIEEIEFSNNQKNLSEGLNFENLLPDDRTSFYCYRDGSLTTPDCNEVVTWTIFPDTVNIGQKQLDSFRTMYFGNSSASHKMVDNFRPLQSLNSRIVYHFNAASVLSSPTGMMIIILLSLWFIDFKKIYS